MTNIWCNDISSVEVEPAASKEDNKMFLLCNARLQDFLLSSYRTQHVVIQLVLLLMGILVQDLYLFDTDNDLVKGRVLYVFVFILLLAIAFNVVYLSVIKSREKDVDYWQSRIIEEENKDGVNKPFSDFKEFQLNKAGLGSVRRNLSFLIFYSFPTLWLLLLMLSMSLHKI